MIVIARLNVGGPASHVVWLAAGLKKAGYTVDLVCGQVSQGEGDMAAIATERGIEPIVIPELRRELHPWRDLVAGFKLLRLIRRSRPEIVHTHTAKAGILGRWAALLGRVPAILHTYHGHVFHSYFGPFKTRLVILLERLTARITRAIITLSPHLRDEIVQVHRIATADRIRVVPLGVDLTHLATCRDSLRGRFRATHNIPTNVPLVGIVGRLVPVKNHQLFIEAVSHVIRELPEAHFAIVGDGTLRGALETRAALLGLADRIRFTGWTRDLASVYADLDVTVISSLNEGTPVSLIESLAAGCPVVATDVGGVRDLLNDEPGTTLVPSGDATRLARAIVDALREPIPMAEVSARICERFSVGRLVTETAALYERLTAEN